MATGGVSLSKTDGPQSLADGVEVWGTPYKEVVRVRVLASTMPYSDVVPTVRTATRLLDKPDKAHWNGIPKTLHCMRRVKDLGLMYGRRNGQLGKYAGVRGHKACHLCRQQGIGAKGSGPA